MFYIINSRGQVVGTSDVAVSAESLAAAGARAIESDLALPHDAVTVTDLAARPRIIVTPVAPIRLLTLSTTLADRDGDGVPELPADGSSADLVVVATTAEGEAIAEQVAVTFRTTGGRLSTRTATTKKGKATVTLTSGHDTVTIEVSASSPGFETARLQLELVP